MSGHRTISCVCFRSQQTHLGCVSHPRTESEKATSAEWRRSCRRDTSWGIHLGSMARDRSSTSLCSPEPPRRLPTLREDRPSHFSVPQPSSQGRSHHCEKDQSFGYSELANTLSKRGAWSVKTQRRRGTLNPKFCQGHLVSGAESH